MIQDHIKKVDLSKKPFEAIGDGGQEYTADSIIISTGAQARWLNLESEQKYRGFGVSGYWMVRCWGTKWEWHEGRGI